MAIHIGTLNIIILKMMIKLNKQLLFMNCKAVLLQIFSAHEELLNIAKSSIFQSNQFNSYLSMQAQPSVLISMIIQSTKNANTC